MGVPPTAHAEPLASGSAGNPDAAIEVPHAVAEPDASATAAPPPSDGGLASFPQDMVETIGEEPETAPLPPPAAAPAADDKSRTTVGGWARERGEYFVAEASPAAGRDDTVSRTDLFISMRHSHGRQMELSVSGVLTSTVVHGNGGSRGSFEPLLHEAYLGFYGSVLDLRIGQQRLAWGATDFFSPNDVMNSRDLRDPFLGESELRFIPTPMLRADWYLGLATFQLVYEPWFVPPQLDVYGTNWAGIQRSAPVAFRNIAAGTIGQYDPSLFDQAQRLYQQTSVPAANFLHPVAGAQVAINGQGFDLHGYYQYGYDGPYVTLDGSSNVLTATYLPRHHVGFDAATTRGPFAFRVEAAYETEHAFFRTDLLSHKSGVVQAVGAMEWQTGDAAKVALFEIYYQGIIDKSEVALLAWDRNSYGAGLLVRWPIVWRLKTDSRVLFGAHPLQVVAKPDLELDFDTWVFGAGCLLVAGRESSFGSYYRRNSEAFAFVKWLF